MIGNRTWLISLGVLLAAGAIGFAAFRLLAPKLQPEQCGPSQAASLALSVVADVPTQKRIQALDAAFAAEFAKACDSLCQDRAQLSERLIAAKPDDPEVSRTLELIHQQQARMELMTWNHIIAVRDLLPAAERAKYIHLVQVNWERSQARLRSVAQLGACQFTQPKTGQESGGK